MEENIKNEIVEQAADKMFEAAENLDKAIAETGVKPASALTELKQQPSTGKNILIDLGIFTGGAVVGYAVDHWVVPGVKKLMSKAKAKHAEKKAQKAAKKAQKEAAAKQEPAPEAPTANDGIDPNTIDTTVKD